MQKITILEGPVSLPAGCRLRLSADQARRRAHVLTEEKGGVYLAEAITQWKTGETLETDAEIPKPLAERVAVEAVAKKGKSSSGTDDG